MDAVREAQEKRKVVVNRLRLLTKLQENMAKHVEEYNKAFDTYKEESLNSLAEGYAKAVKDLGEAKGRIGKLFGDATADEPGDIHDSMILLDRLYFEKPVPKSYAKEYEATIAMVDWSTEEEFTLQYSEFVCFVLDRWDWKSKFENITKMYRK